MSYGIDEDHAKLYENIKKLTTEVNDMIAVNKILSIIDNKRIENEIKKLKEIIKRKKIELELHNRKQIAKHIHDVVFMGSNYAYYSYMFLGNYDDKIITDDMIKNNNIIITNITECIINNEFNGNCVIDLYNWIKYTIFIMEMQNYDGMIKMREDFIGSYSYLYKRLINELFPKRILEEIIEEKYKPSRVQHFIDNYGVDALDEY